MCIYTQTHTYSLTHVHVHLARAYILLKEQGQASIGRPSCRHASQLTFKRPTGVP